MKFAGRGDWKDIKTTYTIGQIVKRETDLVERRGAVERLEDRIEKLAQVVAEMLEQAHTETQVRVANLLGYFSVADDQNRQKDRIEKLTEVVAEMLEQAPTETQVRVANLLGYNPMEDTEGR